MSKTTDFLIMQKRAADMWNEVSANVDPKTFKTIVKLVEMEIEMESMCNE